MNIELIKNCKEAFDYYLEGNPICFKTDIWFDYDKSSHVDPFVLNRQDEVRVVIKNDKYVEFHKALAEGKTIQYTTSRGTPGDNMSTYIWEDMRKIDWLNRPVQYYRIKPKSVFKVGDWVQVNPSVNRPTYVTSIKTSDNGYYNGETLQGTDLTPWKPKPGDWCWFWDEGWHPILKQFDGYNHVNQFLVKKESSTHNRYYNFCEPFIGTLPSIIEDKK